MTELPENTAIVRDFDELSAAVNNMDVNIIYFAEDIELPTSGLVIPATKETLLFDGTHEGVRHSFTDANSSLPTQTLRINAASNIALTFQNMDLIGRNYYGIPYIVELDTSGVSVTYRHITYDGPQIAFNPMGLTCFEDCTIITRSEEVGEVNRVEFRGVNHITHLSSSDAVFWFRGSLGTAYLRVMPDAEVTITTNNYFMYNLIPVFIPTTTNPVAYEVRENASLSITSHHGISLNASHRVSSLSVGMGASFRYVQETGTSGNASLYLEGSFLVNEGARVYLEADYSGAGPLIQFYSGTNLPFSVNNPRRFVLYCKDSAPIALRSAATREFTLSGGQINRWSAAEDFPDAGTLLDPPDEQWHRPDWSEFNLTGTIASGSTQVTGTSLTPDEQQGLPPIEDLVFQTARVLSVGTLPLSPDLIADDGRPISGYTEPGAALHVHFSVAVDDYDFPATAGVSGAFLILPQMTIPAGTMVTIRSNLSFLTTTLEIPVTAAVGEIIIQRSPEFISFRLPPISTNPVLLGRFNFGEAVEVFDDRSVGTQWNLLASISGPLTAESGEVLERALVFRGGDGILRELSDLPLVVYTGGPTLGQTNVAWPDGNGVLLRVLEPIRSGTRYSTSLKWELEIIP